MGDYENYVTRRTEELKTKSETNRQKIEERNTPVANYQKAVEDIKRAENPSNYSHEHVPIGGINLRGSIAQEYVTDLCKSNKEIKKMEAERQVKKESLSKALEKARNLP